MMLQKAHDTLQAIPSAARHAADAGFVGTWLAVFIHGATPYLNFIVALLTILWLSLQIYGWLRKQRAR